MNVGRRQNRYELIIEKIFFNHYIPGATDIEFSRKEFSNIASELNIPVPLNLGDVIYSFRYRNELPEKIRQTAKIGTVQIYQDIALCSSKFPNLICRPIAAQFMGNDLIALFQLEKTNEEIRISTEKHYRLVKPDQLTLADLESYRMQTE